MRRILTITKTKNSKFREFLSSRKLLWVSKQKMAKFVSKKKTELSNASSKNFQMLNLTMMGVCLCYFLLFCAIPVTRFDHTDFDSLKSDKTPHSSSKTACDKSPKKLKDNPCC